MPKCVETSSNLCSLIKIIWSRCVFAANIFALHSEQLNLSYQLIFVDLFVRLIDLIKWLRQSWNIYTPIRVRRNETYLFCAWNFQFFNLLNHIFFTQQKYIVARMIITERCGVKTICSMHCVAGIRSTCLIDQIVASVSQLLCCFVWTATALANFLVVRCAATAAFGTTSLVVRFTIATITLTINAAIGWSAFTICVYCRTFVFKFE